VNPPPGESLSSESLPAWVSPQALPQRAAVLDPAGQIVAVNRAWHWWCENQADPPGPLPRLGVGANLLNGSLAINLPKRQRLVDGLRLLLEGQLPGLEIFYRDPQALVGAGMLLWVAPLAGPGSPLEAARPRLAGALLTIQEMGPPPGAGEPLQRRQQILQAVMAAATAFLRPRHWQTDLEALLAELGAITRASRVCWIEIQPQPPGCPEASPGLLMAAEWQAPGQTSRRAAFNQRGLTFASAGLARWQALLSRGQVIASPVAHLPKDEARLLQSLSRPQTTLSVLEVPVFIYSAAGAPQLHGFLSFHDQEDAPPRRWSQIDIEALRLAAGLLGAAVEHRRAAEALEKSEAEKSLILNTTSEIISYHDLDLRLLWLNQAGASRLGQPTEALIGRPCYEIWHGRGDPCPDCPVRRSLQTGLASEGEITGADGHTYHLRSYPVWGASGQMTGSVELAQDISERRRAEDQLHQITELVSEMIGLVRVYPHGGFALEWATPSYFRFIGSQLEDIATKASLDVSVHPDDLESVLAGYNHMIQAPGVYEIKFRLRRADGAWRWMHITCRALADPSQPASPVARLAVALHDVTDLQLTIEAHTAALSWQELTTSLAAGFNAAAPEQIDDQIGLGLQQLGEHLGADRLRLFEIDQVSLVPGISQLHRWFRPGSESSNEVNWVAEFPTLLQEILRGRPVIYPGEQETQLGAVDLAALEKYGIQAAIVFPILIRGRPLGCLSIVFTRARLSWRAEMAERLNLVGEIFGHALVRRKAELDARLQLRRLAALSEVGKTINASMDLNLTLDILLNHLVAQLEVDAADVLLFNPLLRGLEFARQRGLWLPAARRAGLPQDAHLSQQVARQRRLLHLTGLESASLEAAGLLHEAIETYIGVPLIARGQVKGVLELFQRSALHPNRSWLDYLAVLADYFATAIDSTRQFESLTRANVELSVALDGLIEGWAQAIDLRSQEAPGHTQRAADLALRLAAALRLPDAELVHLRRGALLHNLGKMGLPDSILLKPGPLSEQEWAAVRRHPQIAHDLLDGIPFLRPALVIPHCHQERWDGTGYPRGLAGEQIPLAARIFALADVYDSLLSDRPFRQARGRDQALDYISSQSGLHFDPALVAAFLSLPLGF
jgi:HD-GYP domain-containing protein (c-di-GMP phosphodiesterase class II)/PAS domain-containing protein